MPNLPHFKYSPNAFELGIIKQQDIVCKVCKQKSEYVYTGNFYAIEDIEDICPWCIADGSASKKYDGIFIDDISCEPVSQKTKLNELIHTTPSYASWQGAVWLTHHDDYCAFLNYVGWQEIEHLKDNLADDIEKIKQKSNLTQQQFESYLQNNGDMQGYLFQCLHCDQHRLYVDFS